VQRRRDRDKPITLTLARDVKVVPAVAVYDASRPETEQLSKTNAGLGEEPDDELVAFTPGAALP